MMGGLEEHIRQLNNYGTIFGTFWFNILCVSCNLIEIITSVVLLGYFHSVITIDYIWWPFIEIIRLFILTILRFDVMLKGVENYADNRNGFKYTKRSIIICNLIGFFVILIGAPIYLSLLSTPTNSLYDKKTAYTLFMSIFPIFILMRILLTLPMYCTLLIGTNLFHEINHGYQVIDDAVATQHRRRQNRYRRSQGDGYDDGLLYEERRETHEERVQRQIRRQYRIMQLEQRQMELALEQSRRDAFRNTRKEQDDEYQRELKEAQQQKEKEERERQESINNNDNNNNNNNNQIREENMLFPEMNNMDNNIINNNDNEDTGGVGDEIGIGNENDNEIYNIDNQIELDPLPAELTMEEAPDSECVYVRIRLPNGIRCERRFKYNANINDIILWTQHECMKHNQIHLINHSQLVSTMPHTVYNDGDKTLKQLKFWRPNAKRKLISPTLYVEEL